MIEGENGRFYIPEGYGIPKAIRFIASTNGKFGASLALCDSTSEWLDGSEGWVGFGDNEETTYTFKEGVTFEYIKFSSNDPVVSLMVFVYGDTSKAASLAAAVTYGTPRKGSARLQDVLADETGELLADHDADGNYYLPKLPEGSGIKPVGIRAEVSSKAKAVTFLWNQGDEETEVTPVNGKAYYLFTEEERDNVECVSFKGQKVRNVTVLYWNCEEAKAADEEEGAFDLPDYRIPAAISYTWSVDDEEVKDGEKEAQKDAQVKESGVKLTAKVYDREAGSWKEEGIVLAGKLEVNPEGANVYIITEKNRKALEKVFEEARKAGVAPRLTISADDVDGNAEAMSVYYDQPYTDEDEITGLAENENQDTAQEAGSSDEAEDMDGKPEEDKASQEGSAEEGKPEEPITEGQGKEGSEKEDPAKEESEEEPSAPEDKGQLKSGARKASMPDVRPGQLTIGQEGGFSR